MEIAILIVLVVIAVEGYYICSRKQIEEKVKTDRREIKGTFSDPLGDKYRKNNVGLYRPVRPNREEDDDGI